MLAYHYATAFELARAAGQSERASKLEAPALRFLGLAAERALGLDTAAALASSEHALALAPAGHPDRAVALARFGAAAFHVGRLADAAEALEEAIASFGERGDRLAAARAMGTLAEVLYRTGEPRWAELPAEAVALLEPLPPGPELVSALTDLARAEALQGKAEAGVRHAEQALALAGELGLPRPARTLGYLGFARCDLGDMAGLEDFREAIALATEAGQGREAGVIYGNFGETLWAVEGAVAALEAMRSGIAFAQDRGLAETVTYITGSTLDPLFGNGAFDEALDVAAAIADRSENADVTAQVNAGAARARILSLRGQASQVRDSLNWLESTARGAGAPEYAVIGLAAAALARAALEQNEAAATLLAEILATPGAREIQYYGIYMPMMVRTALELGDRALAERLADGCESNHYPFAAHAGVAVERRPCRGARRPPSRRRRLRPGGGTLGTVRRRPRARVRPPRPGPLPDCARATDRSHACAASKPGRSSTRSRQRPLWPKPTPSSSRPPHSARRSRFGVRLRRSLLRVRAWAYLGLNQGPPACEAGALPLSYTPGKRPGMLADEACRSEPPAPGAGDGRRQEDGVRLAAPPPSGAPPGCRARSRPARRCRR